LGSNSDDINMIQVDKMTSKSLAVVPKYRKYTSQRKSQQTRKQEALM